MDALGTWAEKAQRLPTVLGILAQEIVSLLRLIPYALSTMQLYRYGG